MVYKEGAATVFPLVRLNGWERLVKKKKKIGKIENINLGINVKQKKS